MPTKHIKDLDKGTRASIVTFAVAGIAAVAAYTFVVRPWHNRWGATDEELRMPLPGDGVVARPNMDSTRAITVHAPPEAVWPWLVQMGKGRGGLYSYDWLDVAFGVLDRPSVERILADCQRLEPGDVIPIGSDATELDDFYVHAVHPNRALVLGANDPRFRDRVTWAIVLIPVAPNVTRLIMRVRGEMEMDAKGFLTYALLDPASFIMLRKQMLNLKRLAERTHVLHSTVD